MIPRSRVQRAVQLIGPNDLILNPHKAVPEPGPYQVLARVEVVGLCFSDLKLLKQFSAHVRKSAVVAVLDHKVLKEIPSYVPGTAPAVPGHETVVRIVRKGDQVRGIEVGDRFLVQADYRYLKTRQSNAAFGYNFEGALQEYVLMDQRVFTSPDGESMLLPAADELPASAVALVEPWACVENSYVSEQRRSIKLGGRLLVVTGGRSVKSLLETFLAAQPVTAQMITTSGDVSALEDQSVDDVLFLGADAERLEAVFPKVARNGLVLVVQDGERFGRPVTTPVGRLHYGGLRVAGCPGRAPEDALAAIPVDGEIREGDRINVVGAGGPMGAMHVIRNLCQGVAPISVWGGDLSRERLAMLDKMVRPLAERGGMEFHAYLANREPPSVPFDYTALMVPSPALVAEAIGRSAPGGRINIFAGIPANVEHPLDLDTYCERGLYFIGTSGSDVRDMRLVLDKVTGHTLDTNLSVAAISGLDGAVDGIRAMESQSIPGKIIVYPACQGLQLTPLTRLAELHPDVAALLHDGFWTGAAERKLLALYPPETDEAQT